MNRNGNLIAVFFFLAGALLLASALAQAPGAAPVAVAVVEEKEIPSEQKFVATVMPLKLSSVGSAVDGRVAEFLVNEGDAVKRGQPLARLLMETIDAQVDTAKAELDLRKAERDELKNGTRPEEIEMARAQMDSAKALADYAAARLKRIEALFKESETVTIDELQDTLSKANSTQELYQAAKKAHELAVAGARQEKRDQAEARVRMQEATVRMLKDQQKKHTIIAPFDGFVVAEHTEDGQWLARGDLVAEIAALEEVDVEAQVEESHVAHVRHGMEALVELPAISDKVLVGKVAAILPKADHRSRTFAVKVRLTNTITDDGPWIKAGMLGRVKLPIGAKQTALLVPKDALFLQQDARPMVFVVEPDANKPGATTVRPVQVDLGVAHAGLIQVRGEGLKAGQQVVVEGNERLRPGQEVKVVGTKIEK
ncbi:MAG: efflux RND transporter periplasmic adaptor subunit [Planctomycetia bacterium]|nr:efflux RND transporter periplasmic adaptor subunit [Planctomycetia bacterium]